MALLNSRGLSVLIIIEPMPLSIAVIISTSTRYEFAVCCKRTVSKNIPCELVGASFTIDYCRRTWSNASGIVCTVC